MKADRIFSDGDRVIWDSHFGYDIGYFIEELKHTDQYRIELRSGVMCGIKMLVNISEIHPYSKELIETLTAKYGYQKDWSEVF